MRRLFPLLLCLFIALPAAGLDPSWNLFGSKERRDATRFILEKLRRQSGDNWERVNRFFYWTYDFDKSGCELFISRREGGGLHVYDLEIPIAEVSPINLRDGQLRLLCRERSDCVHYRHSGPGVDDEGELGEARILPPEHFDLPKLTHAFEELSRLCDNPYADRP